MIEKIQRVWQREPVVRLTTAYVGILIILSIVFSSVLYAIASAELDRALGPRRQSEAPFVMFDDRDDFLTWRKERTERAHSALVANIVLFDSVIIIAGGVASYFFAKRTFRPIERALAAQTQFSSDAAHELRTPLTVMQTEIDVALRAQSITKADMREVLESGREEVIHMRTLTDRLLALASDEPLEKQQTTLKNIIDDIQPRLTALCDKKHITLDIKVNNTPVEAAVESVQDVVTILVDNAVKYSNPQTTITITSRKSCLSIADQGVGIAPEHQHRVFDRLYRVDDARGGEHGGGSGLGLSLAQRIMERHGGAITVKSKLGEGSVFMVSL